MVTRTRLSVEPLEGRAVPANFTPATVPELIAAIDAANATPEADAITLVAGTTYTLTAVNNTTDGANGLPVVAAGSTVSIIGSGNVIGRSTATGTPAFRLFDVAAGGSLTLQDLTLQHGQTSSAGGAIYNQGTLALDGVTIRNNTARGWDGGPIGFGGFRDAGSGLGGGVYSNGMLTLTGCTIRDNAAVGGHGLNAVAPKPPKGTGGADPPIRPWMGGPGGNGLGGGLYLAGGTASITGTTISDNTARGGDGGSGYGDSTGKRTAGGDGGDGLGGGVYAAAGAVAFHVVSVTGNHALGGVGGRSGGRNGKGQGGGLYLATDADAGLDAYTVNHTTDNDASNNSRNIRGTYAVIP